MINASFKFVQAVGAPNRASGRPRSPRRPPSRRTAQPTVQQKHIGPHNLRSTRRRIHRNVRHLPSFPLVTDVAEYYVAPGHRFRGFSGTTS